MELDGAIMLDSSSLELHCEVLLLSHADVDCVRRRRNLCLGGHVAPQVLQFHAIVVIDVVPQHLVCLGVGALALPLGGASVAFLVLAQGYTTKKRHNRDILGRTIFFSCHAYDTSMTIIVTKPGIIIDVVGSYFYDKKS